MRLHGVGRRYGLAGEWVLRDVELTVPEGALLRFAGGNGSGKSTLLRLLAGIDAPSTGTITGRPRSAYVPERFPAALPMTALGYLTHLGRVHGLRRAVAVRESGEWLERFGAAEYARTPLSGLSKGTSQKVAVTQALLARPGLLVLDEAWTGLDQAARAVLDLAVAERVRDGGTVVFVDHDPRRLPGATAYGLSGGRLAAAPAHAPHRGRRLAPPAGPLVRIAAVGPPGAVGTSRLPLPVRDCIRDCIRDGVRASASVPEPVRGPHGELLLTVPAADSDAVLCALLAQHWHIASVTPPTRPAENPLEGEDEPGRTG